MRTARIAGLAALVLSVTGGLPLAATAHADAENLYVDKASAGCSDTAASAGSAATPFCTVSAAGAVAQPGQTVYIAPALYREAVHLTHSGTADAPITFAGTGRPGATTTFITLTAFTLDGVHDVRIENLNFGSGGTALAVTGSSRVGLDALHFSSLSPGTTELRISGSSDVTLSRSTVQSHLGSAVLVEGSPRTTVTTNAVQGGSGPGISLTDAPGSAVTSNTIGGGCGSGIALAGDSSGSSIVNNELLPIDTVSTTCAATERPDLSVAPASVGGTVAHHNLVTAWPDPYSWGGQVYPTPKALLDATGQGAADARSQSSRWDARASGAAVDSADVNAPGELAADLVGQTAVDNPTVADSGTGSGVRDRGAYEGTDPMSLSFATGLGTLGHPLDVTLTGQVYSPWYPVTASSIDFGDGGAPVSPLVLPATHTYPRTGSYDVTLSVTSAHGDTRRLQRTILVQEPGPIQPVLTVSQGLRGAAVPDGDLRRVQAVPDGTESPWPVTAYSYDFGDGTPASASGVHVYAKAGEYGVTLKVTDNQGRTASTTRSVVVGDAYFALPTGGSRVLDTRRGWGAPARSVGPGEEVEVRVTGVGGVPAEGRVTAVLLNLTATEPTADSHVTAFPSGGARPNVSSLNFTAGQTVANSVVVPVGPDGAVTLRNNDGRVHLVADVAGYYASELATGKDESGSLLRVEQPSRLLDTRDGTGGHTGRIGPDGTVKFLVRGIPGGAPGSARTVVLNVTATEPTADSYVTASPDGTPPSRSSLNFVAGQTRANQVTVPIDADGTVTLYNHVGAVHLIADLQGFYSSEPVSGMSPYVPVAPTRALDTRDGTGGFRGRLGSDRSLRVRVAGGPGQPATALAVLVNVTATNPATDGHLIGYAAGAPRPTTSIVNFAANSTVPNLVLLPVGADGSIEIYNRNGATDVIVDVQGYVG